MPSPPERPPRRERRLVAGAAAVGAAAIGAAVLAGGSAGGQPTAVVRGTSDPGGTSGASAAAGSARCVPPPAGTRRLSIDTAHPPVVVHVPPGTAPASRRPLVLVLPGAGQTARDIASYTGYSHLADLKGFLVAYPTATGSQPSWNISGTAAGKPDDVAYLRKVITTLTGPAACAAPSRVGVTGVSNGGGMSARMACDAADLLAAAAPVAGGYSSLPDCRPERPLPILEIHGLKDTVVPFAGKGPTGAGSVPGFLAAWRRRDGCPSRAARTMPAPNVLELRWSCADGREVAHDRVLDAQHGWPGESSLEPFSSTLTTWRFLSRFRLER